MAATTIQSEILTESLVKQAAECIDAGFGDDDTHDVVLGSALIEAPAAMTVGQLREIVERAIHIAVAAARAAGHRNVL